MTTLLIKNQRQNSTQRHTDCNVLVNGFILITLLFTVCFSADRIAYSPTLSPGTMCVIDVRILRPTQFAVGYCEIERRAEKLMGKDAKKIEKYLKEHVGKVVIGPGGIPYIIDRHHLACIMLKTTKSLTIYATISANFSTMSIDNFWEEMITRKWAYLYDEKGNGPLDPQLLPKSLKDLKDDPFRSLAWAVRERDGFRVSTDPFAEFQWANFFRTKFNVSDAKVNIVPFIQKALKLCHTSAASGLPGYFEVTEIQK